MTVWFARALFLATLGVTATAQDIDLSIWAGAYTTAQAVRGQTTFENNCSECHMSDLSGRAGPALKGDAFMEHWHGKVVGALFDKIQTTMPADRRTRLTDTRTLDLVAFLLQQNGFPAGDRELSTDIAGRIKMVP